MSTFLAPLNFGRESVLALAARLRPDLTQGQVAAAIGLSLEFVLRVDQGVQALPAVRARMLAVLLGTDSATVAFSAGALGIGDDPRARVPLPPDQDEPIGVVQYAPTIDYTLGGPIGP